MYVESSRACHRQCPGTPRSRLAGALVMLLTGLLLWNVAVAQQGGSMTSTTSSAEILSHTRLLIKERRYDEALITLRKAREFDISQLAEMRELLAEIYWGQGRYGSSIRAYENLLSTENLPTSAQARAFQALAQLYTIEENHTKALEYLDLWAQISTASDTGTSKAQSAPEQQQPMPTVERPKLETAVKPPSGKLIDGAVSSTSFKSSLDDMDLSVTADEYHPVVRVAPVYPERAVEMGVEGYVIVECTVTENGSVRNATVVESTNPLLDRAALKAVKQFKFKPRIVNGEYIEVTGVRQKVTFRLE